MDVRSHKVKPNGTISEFLFALRTFLEQIFTKEFLEREVSILQTHSKRKDNYSYLVDINVHPAARWWLELTRIIQQKYRVNPMLHSQVLAFMESAMFYVALTTLLNNGSISLNDPEVIERLKDRRNFLPYTYELLIAANYASHDYLLEFPEKRDNVETVDLYVSKDNISAYIECKKLSRNAHWQDVAIETLKYLDSIRPNSYLLSATFSKAPKSRQIAIEYSQRIISRIKKSDNPALSNDASIDIKELPTFIVGNPDSLSLRIPPDIEYYTFLFHYNPLGIISEPRIIILRNTGKLRELRNSLTDRLKTASAQLKKAQRKDALRLIAVDITSFLLEIANPWTPAQNENIIKQVEFVRSYITHWISRNKSVDGVIITRSKLYLNPYNYPLAIVMQPEYILRENVSIKNVPRFEGWSIELVVR